MIESGLVIADTIYSSTREVGNVTEEEKKGKQRVMAR
jgi:hypothetical protein